MKKNLYDLVGKELKHKKYGMCQVIEVVDFEEFKISIKILEDSVIKKVLFSSNYFEGIEDYESLVLPEYVKKEKRVYRQVDVSKYRRHPLVKSIDAREQGIKILQNDKDNEEENEENV